MSEEELLRKNNVLMSHGNLPCDTTTCETYGLSGNCGKDCSNFKSKTCDVYVDVLERINEELQEENQKYKEVIEKVRKLIKKHYFKESDDYYDYFTEGVCLQDGDYNELEDILKEVE